MNAICHLCLFDVVEGFRIPWRVDSRSAAVVSQLSTADVRLPSLDGSSDDIEASPVKSVLKSRNPAIDFSMSFSWSLIRFGTSSKSLVIFAIFENDFTASSANWKDAAATLRIVTGSIMGCEMDNENQMIREGL